MRRVGEEAFEGLRPPYSAHVRWGEHGAPVPGVRDSVSRRSVELADEKLVTSHISPKTGEIWGTQGLPKGFQLRVDGVTCW
jgi:hypothetical protein